jgi:hypothetical protein
MDNVPGISGHNELIIIPVPEKHLFLMTGSANAYTFYWEKHPTLNGSIQFIDRCGTSSYYMS